MLPTDAFRWPLRALAAHRLRSALTLLGIAVGIAAVILLTAIGEGIHRFVLAEFTQFGTRVVEIKPGKTSTGGIPASLFSTVKPLTLDDASALARLPGITAVTPIVSGNAEIEAGGRVRRTTVTGAGAALPAVFSMHAAVGRFLPDDDAGSARPFVVLGARLKAELFGGGNALGERVRIGGNAFRVIGVMAAKGQFLGVDLDDTAYIPAARALELYNRVGLMAIDVSYGEQVATDAVAQRLTGRLADRHGRADFTLTTQEDMLRTLSNILAILTGAVAALGGISLFVGAIGITTIMTIAVSERTHEIGLLIALGAPQGLVQRLFLGEAVILAGLGGLAGLVIGGGFAGLLWLAVPALPVHLPWLFVVLAEASAMLIGLLAGVLPARAAARLPAVAALRAE